MAPFRSLFTAPVFEHALVLLMGAMLAPGKRTVSSALRITGRAAASNFTCYHQVLNRARWSSLAVAGRLLMLIIDHLVPDGPVVIGIDDTIERRWGPKIAARGIYRDPVRSSHAHFVKTSGLRWLSFMVLCPVPWANRVKALPFLSILAPSERSNRAQGKVHKRLTDWTRRGILQICRWLPARRLVFVGDSSFAVLDLLASVRRRCAVISRRRLDANLYAPPPTRGPHTMGRPAAKGKPLPKLKTVAKNADTVWRRTMASEWYGDDRCELDLASGTGALVQARQQNRSVEMGPRPRSQRCASDPGLLQHRYRSLPGRYPRLLRPALADGSHLCRGARMHLGVETQRQWSELAILRTTPTLLGLYSLITLWATEPLSIRPHCSLRRRLVRKNIASPSATPSPPSVSKSGSETFTHGLLIP